MNIYTITFSPTGGTQRCADALAGAIGNVTKFIDLTSHNMGVVNLNKEDVAVIAVPSYSGRVPALAIQRIKHNIKANGARAILLVVYGNRAYEDTMIELSDVAEECGFTVIAGVSAVAKHSIVGKIASERPDPDDLRILAEYGKRIAGKLSSGTSTVPSIPGNHPYRKAGKGIVPKTRKSYCNTCGKCATLCPAGAIDSENPLKVDKNLCITCMRCVTVCPHEARYVPGIMLWMVGQMLKKPCATRKEPELFI